MLSMAQDAPWVK